MTKQLLYKKRQGKKGECHWQHVNKYHSRQYTQVMTYISFASFVKFKHWCFVQLKQYSKTFNPVTANVTSSNTHPSQCKGYKGGCCFIPNPLIYTMCVCLPKAGLFNMSCRLCLSHSHQWLVAHTKQTCHIYSSLLYFSETQSHCFYLDVAEQIALEIRDIKHNDTV